MTDRDEMPPAAEFDIITLVSSTACYRLLDTQTRASLPRALVFITKKNRARCARAYIPQTRVLRRQIGPYHFHFASDAPAYGVHKSPRYEPNLK